MLPGRVVPVLVPPSTGRRAPDFRDFAVLGSLEACVRGTLVAVWPVQMYQALGSKETVSWVYFAVGIAALVWGVAVPTLGGVIPRRWLYTAGTFFYFVAMALAAQGGAWPTSLGLLAMGVGVITNQICFSAYLMDYIARTELGRSETLRMFYSAVPWTLGPILSVSLWKIWQPGPFVFGAFAAAAMLAQFWRLRLGDGKAIMRAARPAPNPVVWLGRFVRQPRLVAGWTFAVVRSSGWWVFVVYLPIFCIEAGLGDRIASLAFSASSLMLLLAPLLLRWPQRASLRRAVRAAFAGSAACFVIAALGAWWPLAAVGGVLAAAFFLVCLDAFGSLPFLMAVRPAERTEMSAVFSSYRDVSGVVTPGVAALVLTATGSIPAVFLALAAAMAGASLLAARMNPRLGTRRR